MSHTTTHKVLRWGRSAYEKEEDLQEEARQLRAMGLIVEWEAGLSPSWDGVKAVIVHSKKHVDQAVMEQAKDLQLIITTTSGYDHIDCDAAKAHGISVARSPLARRDAVIETTFAMAFALRRDLAFFQRQAAAEIWARSALPTRQMPLLRGTQVGIIGHGVIGQRAKSTWEALGAHVQFYDPADPASCALDQVLATSQLLTLHCSLTATSRQLLHAESIRQLPRGAIVLNTARGECADVDALFTALQEGHLGGVGLDVFPQEPYPTLARLAAHPQCIVTPHAAGYHDDLGRAVTAEVVNTLAAWQQDRPLPHQVV